MKVAFRRLAVICPCEPAVFETEGSIYCQLHSARALNYEAFASPHLPIRRGASRFANTTSALCQNVYSFCALPLTTAAPLLGALAAAPFPALLVAPPPLVAPVPAVLPPAVPLAPLTWLLPAAHRYNARTGNQMCVVLQIVTRVQALSPAACPPELPAVYALNRCALASKLSLASCGSGPW